MIKDTNIKTTTFIYDKDITCEKTRKLLQKMIKENYADMSCNSNFDIYQYEICSDRLNDALEDEDGLFNQDDINVINNLISIMEDKKIDIIII